MPGNVRMGGDSRSLSACVRCGFSSCNGSSCSDACAWPYIRHAIVSSPEQTAAATSSRGRVAGKQGESSDSLGSSSLRCGSSLSGGGEERVDHTWRRRAPAGMGLLHHGGHGCTVLVDGPPRRADDHDRDAADEVRKRKGLFNIVLDSFEPLVVLSF